MHKDNLMSDFDRLNENEKVLYLYSEGAGDAEICRGIELSKEDFDQRFKSDPKFAKLVSFGRTIALAWWEEKLREISIGKQPGNAAVIKMIMQNRYGWSDKSETDSKSALTVEAMTLDEAKQKLREIAPALTKIIEEKQSKH